MQIISITTVEDMLYSQLLKLWNDTGISNPARCDSISAINHSLQHTGTLLVAIDKGELIGSAWLTHDYRRLYIHHMAVAPKLQNQGIGGALLIESLAVASALGYQAKLEVHEANVGARYLYGKYGFQELPGYITYIKRDISVGSQTDQSADI